MNYLSVENLTKSFGERVLFNDLTFGIEKGQKVAFIAKNGTGKSTFLSILNGDEGYDSGTVAFRNGVKTGFLRQSPNFDDTKTINETLFKEDSEILKAIKEYEAASADYEDTERMNKAFENMEALNAWDYEARIKQILGKLNIHDLTKKISELSGGQQKRVSLAQVLIEDPDFVILDEPTNHLDIEMIEWLEKFLVNDSRTILMVTHDRYFLERVCNEIIELDNKQLYKYKGNYAYFLQKKQEREEVMEANIDKAKNLFKKELEWMRRMPKARGTKAKYREDAFYDTKEKAHQKVDKSKVELEINMSRIGGKIIEMHHVKKSYGDHAILNDFSYTFKKRERVGIVGKNGTGKSTFLNMITGKEPVSGGKISIGETIVFGYYSQMGMNLKEEKRVVEVIRDIGEFIPLTKGKKLSAVQLLERFLFPKEQHYTYVSKLSGGERKRLYLCTILMKNPNFLILDEPTNDLDIVTLNVLENFLEEFPGCLVIVTHDRYFMDKLVDHLFVLEGNGEIKDFNGKYTDYQNYIQEKEETEKEIKDTLKERKVEEKPKPIEKEKTKLSFKEKFEFEQLEKELEELEDKKTTLTNKINQNSPDDDMNQIMVDFSEVIKEIDTKTERWMELAEYM